MITGFQVGVMGTYGGLGPELLTNPGPFADAAGWTSSDVSTSIVNDALRCVSPAFGYIAQRVTLSINTTYRFSAQFSRISDVNNRNTIGVYIYGNTWDAPIIISSSSTYGVLTPEVLFTVPSNAYTGTNTDALPLILIRFSDQGNSTYDVIAASLRRVL